MIPTHDQLFEAIEEGYYPSYDEPKIDFQPTYKMSTSEHLYVNKNDQAPSYCDRALFKKTKPGVHNVDFYSCMHHIHGSDHRPVQLGVTLKKFGHPTFASLPRLLDMTTPRQGYGEIKI